MAEEWRVTVDAHDAERRIRRLSLMLSDLRPFWPLVVPVFTGWLRRQFETEGEFAGSRWAPLSPAYAAWKSKVRPGKSLLVFDGTMRRAASNPIRSATPRTLTLSIEDDKLGYHQEGGTNLPARPLVFGSPLPPMAELELRRAADRYVTDLLRRI